MENEDRPEALDLDTEQNELVTAYLQLQTSPENDKEQAKERNKICRKLDGMYWKRVSSFVARRISEGRTSLSFTEEERLIIDMGYLDPLLVIDADSSFSERLLEEMNISGSVNHYYFSEWLEDRYRRQLLAAQVEAQAEVHEAHANTELAKLTEARTRLFESLMPQFEGLPGVPPEITRSITSGSLDDQLQLMGIALMEKPHRAGFIRRHRLRNLRASVINKVRARVNSETNFKRLDAVDGLYSRIWSVRYQQYEMEGLSALSMPDVASATATATAVRMGELLEAEIKFAKSLLPLGALAGGITKTSPILYQDRVRITKADIQRALDRSRECDRGFTADPVVMIAPFEGRGIFEWDRDSLVIPLHPVKGADDAIANATGNYLMLIDSFQEEGRLKSAYEQAFTESNFQAAFQNDYRLWLCGVGHGKMDSMTKERFEFFRTYVGPETQEVLGPATLRHLSPQAREAVAKRLKKQISNDPANANLLFRLGVIEWLNGDSEEAIRQFAKALTQDPENGMATFAVGMILHRRKATTQAQQAFRACIKRVPNSIWAVYAQRILSGEER